MIELKIYLNDPSELAAVSRAIDCALSLHAQKRECVCSVKDADTRSAAAQPAEATVTATYEPPAEKPAALEDVSALAISYAQSKGTPALVSVLQKFGAKRVSDVPSDKLREFSDELKVAA